MSTDKIQLNTPYNLIESKYLKKVNIDFEDLPHYIIQKGIIWKFESGRFNLESDFAEWREKLISFLDTVPKKFDIKSLEKGIEYGKKVYKYHLNQECKNPTGCPLNQSWDRRIGIAENILSKMVDENNIPDPKEFAAKSSGTKDNGQQIVPIIKLSTPERLWLEEIYSRLRGGIRFTFKEIRGKLHSQLPIDFRPIAMDEKLVSGNGEEIRLLGVVAVEKNYTILSTINKIIETIQGILLTDPEKRNIETMTIAQKCGFSVELVSLSLRLARDYGDFYMGSSYDSHSTLLKSIDVGGSDAVYYEYIQFSGIEPLIIRKSYRSKEDIEEIFSAEEVITMNDKLDAVMKELQTLKNGQEIIWTDMVKELNELKELYSLNKKKWKQLFIGKILDMVSSGIISETVSKKIVDVVTPVITNVLNQPV